MKTHLVEKLLSAVNQTDHTSESRKQITWDVKAKQTSGALITGLTDKEVLRVIKTLTSKAVWPQLESACKISSFRNAYLV